MVIAALKRASTGFMPIVAMMILLLVSLYLMSAAIQNSEEFGRLYFLLLIINVFGLVILLVLIGTNLTRLVRQYRSGATGSRLTMRLVIMFTILALAPVSVVYYFSLQFIQSGIDSWFDVSIETALDDALELSRISLDTRKLELLRQTEQMAELLEVVPDDQTVVFLNDLRNKYDAFELTLLANSGHIIASSSLNPAVIVPSLPDETILRQLDQGINYVGLDPVRDEGLHVRVALKLPAVTSDAEPRYLLSLYPIPERMGELVDSVESAFGPYQELILLRGPLKFSFTVTLSLVLLLSLLTAVWAAFFAARRLVAPIRVLAIGTRAVAAGDYDKHLPLHSSDELGFLVQSFNDMTRKIAQARDDVMKSQQQAEGERAYLRAVLGRLSSGVLTLDKQHIVRTANAAAGHILDLDPRAIIGNSLKETENSFPHLVHFFETINRYLEGEKREWREEVVVFGTSGRQVLICGGASLSDTSNQGAGHVIVFDDVTALVQAQRDSAWGEVARRLAHEIKNPLTPIQLSAERLRHKYLHTMDEKDAAVLERSTHTIVQQVEAMKEMVKAFAEYARTPQLKLSPVDVNIIINEVLDLYRGHDTRLQTKVILDDTLPKIEADATRLRQLLHNLIKNSIEATRDKGDCCVTLSTRRIKDAGIGMIELRVDDNGPGIPDDMIGRFFEPYITTKPKGSGLGLAIVKKIVEEHGGLVWAENLASGGASIIIHLPVAAVAQEEHAS